MSSSSTSLTGLFLAAAGALSFLALKPKLKTYERKLPPTDKKLLNESILNLQIDENEFLDLLKQMIGNAEKLQNNPPTLIPQEDLIADIVLQHLKPYSTEQGGPLKVRKVTYVQGRSNVIIEYPGTTNKVVSFVGSHMDVVPATPADWERNPFELTVEGDKLHGRGVTDCLGHVALITNFFKQLAILKPELTIGVAAIFIANEENSSILGVGIDEMEKHGELKFLQHAPLFWVDSANMSPTIGTGGIQTWELTAVGKGFHSGLPHKGINAIDLATEALKYIQKRFYRDFPHSEQAAAYNYEIGSSLKPTQISTPPGGITQIPARCTIAGDIRFLPFFTAEQIQSKVESYVAELNDKIIRNGGLRTMGYEHFVLPEGEKGIQGLIQWKWTGHASPGVAVDLNSLGFRSICDAVNDINGSVKPFSLTGSLPIIADLKAAGYDVQITGFGKMEAYHAVNEFAYLSDFIKGSKVISHIIAHLDVHLGKKQ